MRHQHLSQPVRSRKFLVLMLLALITILFSACSFETHIYIYKDERWKVDEILEFPKDLGSMSVEVEGIGISLPINTELPFTIAFNQMVQMCPRYSWQCELHKSAHGDEIRYHLVAKGQGYDSLARFFNLSDETFSEQMEEQDSNVDLPIFSIERQGNLVHISSGDGTGIEDAATAALMEAIFPVKVAIHGKKIISSNADEVKGGTAIWHSAKPIDVTLEPGGGLLSQRTLTIILVMITSGAVLAGISFLLLSRVLSHVPAFSGRTSQNMESSIEWTEEDYIWNSDVYDVYDEDYEDYYDTDA